MILKKARYVPINVRTELWGRAAGRCQFNGCNKILYRSSVTQEQGNFSDEAHYNGLVFSDSPIRWILDSYEK